MPDPIHFHTPYGHAPDLVQEKAIQLSGIIEKQKAMGAKPDALKFYEELAIALKHAYVYMIDARNIYQRAELLQQENNFLKEQLRITDARLQEYIIVEKLIAEDRLDEVSRRVLSLFNKISDLNTPNTQP